MGTGRNEKTEETTTQEEEEEDEQVQEPKEHQKFDEGPEGIELKKVRIDRDIINSPIVVLGDSKPFFKTSHLRYTLLAFNGILGILGLILLIIGIWARVDPKYFMYQLSLDISSFYTVCYLCIVAGLVLVMMTCVGCFGVLIEHKPLLWTYLVIFVIIFIIQLAAVILVFSAPYSTTIKSALDKQIKKRIAKSQSDDSSRKFMDFMQQHLGCCGSTSQDDYEEELPKSCKNPDTGIVLTDGCVTKVVNYLRSKSGLIGGITIPILFLQLLAKFFCYCLIRNLRRESGYTM